MLPNDDWTGNFPVKSVYILSVAKTMAVINIFVLVLGGAGTWAVGFVFVDCKFCLSWSRCPFPVWSDLGRCFRTSFFVRPGKVLRKPLSIASRRVDGTGNPRDAWCS